MPKAPRPPKAEKASGGILASFAHRPRLIAGAAIMVVTYVFVPHDIREATRLLIAWNVGAWAFLVMIALMMADPRREARVQARPEDENQWVLVVLGIVAALAAIAAIVWELGPVKDLTGLAQGLAPGARGRDDPERLDLPQCDVRAALRRRLLPAAIRQDSRRPRFSRQAEPGWGEFVYQAFAVGCTFASSDVNITSTRMRRICAIQGVVFFFFNAIILALTINIAANLF